MGQGDATIIAAIIAAVSSLAATVLSLYSIKVTKKGNKDNIKANEEITKRVQEAEDKRVEAQIDANIVWNARVEWIQNVRQVTAEFITACYKFLQSNENEEEEQNKNLELIQKNKALLILYFGPDNIENKKIEEQDILNAKSNTAKNNLVVKLINEIFEQAKICFEHSSDYNICKKDLLECFRCEFESEDLKLYLCEDDYGDKYTKVQCERRQAMLREEEMEYKNEIDAFIYNIDKLSETMRIYLKIEWNNTKNRNK